MPKPRVNEKAIAAMEKKAAHQREVEAKKRAELEAIEAKEWEKGAKTKTKREIELEKRALKNAKKQESEELLAIEEQNMKKKNSKSKSGNPLLDLKPKYKPIQPARGKEKQAQKKQEKIEKEFEDKQKATGANVESFAASNIDDALDILSGGSGSSDIRGSKKDTPIIDKHPERRAKAAYAAFEERELPIMRKENPALRLTQVKQLLWKKWQKSPENPFNQAGVVAYNASRDDEKKVSQDLKRQMEDRLRIR